MIKEQDPSFYDRDYFEDGIGSGKSNYWKYGHGFWLDSQFALTALHICLETFGSKFSDKQATIVDLGGAKGLLVSQLQRFMPRSLVLNSDWSQYATENTSTEVKRTTIRNDVRRVPLPSDSCDLAICIDVLEHIDSISIPQAILEIRRILKPGAKAVIVPNIGEDEAVSRDVSHISIYPREWWREIIEDCGLTIKEEESKRATKLAIHIGPLYIVPSLKPGSFIVEK